MVNRRLQVYCVVSYFILFITTSKFVDGLPNPVEYISEVGKYLSKRVRRNAVNFHRAIRCYQPDIIVLGTYGNYGCYCGFSGSGSPLDETDKCCEKHDRCYVEAGNVKSLWESFLIDTIRSLVSSYENHCLDGEVVCVPDSPYGSKLCNCDKEAARCFHEASRSYHPQLYGVDTQKFCGCNANVEELNLTTNYENRYYTHSETTTASFLEKETTGIITSKSSIQAKTSGKPEEDFVIPSLAVSNSSALNIGNNREELVINSTDKLRESDAHTIMTVNEQEAQMREGNQERTFNATDERNVVKPHNDVFVIANRSNEDLLILPTLAVSNSSALNSSTDGDVFIVSTDKARKGVTQVHPTKPVDVNEKTPVQHDNRIEMFDTSDEPEVIKPHKDRFRITDNSEEDLVIPPLVAPNSAKSNSRSNGHELLFDSGDELSEEVRSTSSSKTVNRKGTPLLESNTDDMLDTNDGVNVTNPHIKNGPKAAKKDTSVQSDDTRFDVEIQLQEELAPLALSDEGPHNFSTSITQNTKNNIIEQKLDPDRVHRTRGKPKLARSLALPRFHLKRNDIPKGGGSSLYQFNSLYFIFCTIASSYYILREVL